MQISDNEIYLLIKYIKSIFLRVEKRLSYIEEARCLKVKNEWSYASAPTWAVTFSLLFYSLRINCLYLLILKLFHAELVMSKFRQAITILTWIH